MHSNHMFTFSSLLHDQDLRAQTPIKIYRENLETFLMNVTIQTSCFY